MERIISFLNQGTIGKRKRPTFLRYSACLVGVWAMRPETEKKQKNEGYCCQMVSESYVGTETLDHTTIGISLTTGQSLRFEITTTLRNSSEAFYIVTISICCRYVGFISVHLNRIRH
jgi:hypothetical protein